MALIILTDSDFIEALKSVIKRCAFVLVPLSVVFIKYFPDIGRGFDPWSGIAENRGVSYNKNGLGYMLMICGFIICWDTLNKWQLRKDRVMKYGFYVNVILLSMVGWLFFKARSATSAISFLIGISIYVFLQGKDLKKSAKVVNRLVVIIFAAAIPLYGFGYDYLLSTAVDSTGHSDTFWGRVELWKRLLEINIHPLIGTGFESFWLGSRLSTLWSERWWMPTEAHNGYLEVYLNLGWIGLVLFAVVFLTVYKKALKSMINGSDYGIIRFAYLVMIVLYNITESALRGLSPVWLMFLIIAIDYRRDNQILRLDEKTAFPH
jgi:O-antigen ligase